MSKPLMVAISKWVDAAKPDPMRHLERQATEIVLNTLGRIATFDEKICLKGGILMSVLHLSPRQTADLDFSASVMPTDEIVDQIREYLDGTLPNVAARLGYPEINCKVQSIARKPNRKTFKDEVSPALKIKIGYAKRDGPVSSHLSKGRSPHVIQIDISFNEPIFDTDVIAFDQSGNTLCVYSPTELIAEKFRALIQQSIRDRFRRQDVFDIAWLLRQRTFDEGQRARIHQIFVEKCAAREIKPDISSISDPDVIRRAQADWETMEIEIGDVPNFEDCYAAVLKFYRSLPWGG